MTSTIIEIFSYKNKGYFILNFIHFSVVHTYICQMSGQGLVFKGGFFFVAFVFIQRVVLIIKYSCETKKYPHMQTQQTICTPTTTTTTKVLFLWNVSCSCIFYEMFTFIFPKRKKIYVYKNISL